MNYLKEFRSIIEFDNDEKLKWYEINYSQVKKLSSFLLSNPELKYKLKNPNKWLKLFSTDNILFSRLSYSKENKIKDQKNRALEIVNYMLENKIYDLITMDGHGRFVQMIFSVLNEKNKDINNYKIHLIDIDSNVNQWHELFMPSNVRVGLKDKYLKKDCLNKNNICNILSRKLLTGEFGKKFTVYFNFCTIPSYDLTALPIVIQKCLKGDDFDYIPKVFISIPSGTRGPKTNKHTAKKILKTQLESIGELKLIKNNVRKDFFSYSISPFESYLTNISRSKNHIKRKRESIDDKSMCFKKQKLDYNSKENPIIIDI